MKIKIELIDGSSMGTLLEKALKEKGYSSYSEFARLVMQKTGGTEHGEFNSIANLIKGLTSRVTPARARAYAEILGIPEETLLPLCKIGTYHKAKPILIEDTAVITDAIKKMATQDSVSMEDLVKELLYLSHQ